MDTYEIVIITKTGVSTEEIEATVGNIAKNVGGSVVSVDLWGERKFVYPIKDHMLGLYWTFVVNVQTDKIKEFERLINFEQELLRTMILQKTDK